MLPIKAPLGYEGSRHYDDGVKSWRATARHLGSIYWTNCGIIGPVGMPEERLNILAEEIIEKWIKLGMVK